MILIEALAVGPKSNSPVDLSGRTYLTRFGRGHVLKPTLWPARQVGIERPNFYESKTIEDYCLERDAGSGAGIHIMLVHR